MGRGRRVGRYWIGDEIAAGGMATVHLGTLAGALGFTRTVAIKCLHSTFAKDPAFVSMLRDEARIVSRIRSAHVVPVLDVEVEDDTLIVVMEYVHGDTLAAIGSAYRGLGERIPWRIACGIVVGALRGLHDAHETCDEHGAPLHVVHRDVSPQNVLLGVDGVARVLDFGVAKAAGRFHKSRTGEIKGKLSYMPPEQLQGEGVTRRADIYAAAVVLWEALTGRRLHEGETDAIVIGKVLRGEAAPPGELVRDIPPEVDEVVMRGLSRDPRGRYATALEMALALEAAIGTVTPAELAECLERACRDVLAQRAAMMKRVDSPTAVDAPAAGAPSTPGLVTEVVARAGSTGGDRSNRSTRRVGLALGVGAALVAAVGLVWSGRQRVETPAVASSEAASIPPASAPVVEPAPPPAAAETAAANSATPVPTASDTTAPARAPREVKARSQSAARSSRPAPKLPAELPSERE